MHLWGNIIFHAMKLVTWLLKIEIIVYKNPPIPVHDYYLQWCLTNSGVVNPIFSNTLKLTISHCSQSWPYHYFSKSYMSYVSHVMLFQVTTALLTLLIITAIMSAG